MKGNLEIGSLLKNRMTLLIGLTAFLLTGSLVLASRHSHQASEAATALTIAQQPLLIAGPGRVEPSSEDIKIGSELSGRLSW